MTDSESDAGTADPSSEPSPPPRPSEIVLFEGAMRLAHLELKLDPVELLLHDKGRIRAQSYSYLEGTILDERGNEFTVPLTTVPNSLLAKMVEHTHPVPYLKVKITLEN